MNVEKRKGFCILRKKTLIRAGHSSGKLLWTPAFHKRGSLTIEAALILPLFLFACLAVLSVMDMLTHFMDTELKLYQTARSAAVYGYGVTNEDWIRLKLVYPVKGFGGRFSKTLLLENHVNVHVFNGYSGDDPVWEEESDVYVYVTSDSEVYHRQRSCKHLNVSVRQVSGSSVGNLRNEDGGKYYKCSYCARAVSSQEALSGSVFVTDYGRLYHTRIDCPDLKRTVHAVKLSEVGGRRPCKDCG